VLATCTDKYFGCSAIVAVATACLLMVTLVGNGADAKPSSAFDKRHRLFTQDLRKYVDGNGVHYSKWKRDQTNLSRYLQSLAELTADDYEKLSANDRKALWLDVYDALTIKIVLDHYPIHGNIPYYPENSLRQIPEVWEAFKIDVAGRKLNLYQIEHDILRREVKDTRTHFTVSCAAKGAGRTPASAYTAKNLNRALNEASLRFLADKDNLTVDSDKKIVSVSKIFKWFPLDFALEAGFKKIPFPPPTDDDVILGYLALHGPKQVQEALEESTDRAQYKVVYREFDWSLNDADAPSQSQSTLRESAAR
jgi:hypothetical protein